MTNAEIAFKAADIEIKRVWSKRTRTTDIKPIELTLDLSGVTYNDLEKLPDSFVVLSTNPDLTKINLSNTQITDFTRLSDQMESAGYLQEIHLNNTQISDEDLKRIFSFNDFIISLKKLNLDNTQVSYLTPFKDYSLLEELFLNNTKVKNLEPIAQLTNLRSLHLNNTEVQASDLKLLNAIKGIVESPSCNGICFKNTTAARLDPRIAEIAEIDDPKDRAKELFAYLK